MATVKADLNGVTVDGRLLAYTALVEGAERSPQVGDRVTVLDLFGDNECYAATVASMADDRLLLDVAWDTPGRMLDNGLVLIGNQIEGEHVES